MRYDSEHKAQTRERVLTEAAAAIRAEGPDRVGVAALMKRAGLTHGGFYAHFKSKDDLLAEAVDHMFAEAYAAFFADSDARNPRDVLSRYVEYYLSTQHCDARDHGCPVPILAGEMHRMPELAKRRFSAGVERMRTRMAGLLEHAGVEDARARAESAVTELVGTICIARVMDDPGSAGALLAAARRSVRRKLDLGQTDAP